MAEQQNVMYQLPLVDSQQALLLCFEGVLGGWCVGGHQQMPRVVDPILLLSAQHSQLSAITRLCNQGVGICTPSCMRCCVLLSAGASTQELEAAEEALGLKLPWEVSSSRHRG
jgi:hypothetical protein